MSKANLGVLSKLARKPYYMFWKTLKKNIYSGRDYTIHVPSGHRMFTPWFNETSTDDLVQKIRQAAASGPLLASPDRCYMLCQLARRAMLLEGDIAECGVYQGASAFLLASLIADEAGGGRRLHLFDTFTGVPDITNPERDYHAPGAYADATLQSVKKRLARFEQIIEYHPGMVPDTFAALDPARQYVFVHIDIDLYDTVTESCAYFWPRLKPGGIALIGDYGFYPYRFAAKAAVDAFFASEVDKPILLPSGQAMIIKSPPH